MRLQWFITAALIGVVAVGCGDEKEAPPLKDAFVQTDAVFGDGGGLDMGTGETVEVTRLSFVKSVAVDNDIHVDLVIYDFDEDELFNLTAGTGVNCRTKSCRVNGDMTWIGWLDNDPAGGLELWVAPVDVRRKVVNEAEKRLVDTQVVAFNFTKDLVVWSSGVAVGPEGMIDVEVEPVAGETGECPNAEDPTRCRQFVGNINGDGAFRVTDFGTLIILIKTTLSTMTIDFFNVGNGANQTLYTFGEQGGTGSQFSGNLPVTLSRDATYLAVFTRNEFIWRAHTLDAIPNPPDPRTLDLYEVQTAQQGDCQRMMPYNFNEVRFNPVFNADSSAFYFLAAGNCSRMDTGREDFDIMRLDRDAEGPIVNVTQNARVRNGINHDIGDFAVSPDDHWLAFTAGRPDNVTSRSIWVLDLQDEGDVPKYSCRGEPRVGIDGRTRCEFIFDDRNNATIIHRDLHFHTVNVPK